MATAAKADDYVPDDEVGSGPSGPPPIRFTWNPANPSGCMLQGLPTRHDLIVATDEGRKLNRETLETLDSGAEILFLPWDVEETVHYPSWEERKASGAKWEDKAAPSYELNLLGVFQDGSNVRIIVPDAPVYFGVWLGEEAEGDPEAAANWTATLMGLLQEFNVQRVEDGEALPLRGFRPAPRPYKRLFFPNLDLRSKAITAVRRHGFETFSDDKGKKNYFRLLARENHLPVSDWLRVNGYSYRRGGQPCGLDPPTESGAPPQPLYHRLLASQHDEMSPLSAHVLTVPFANLRALVNPLKPDPEVVKLVESTPSLSRERTLVFGWDIETHSPDKGLGTPPNACKPNDVVFNICVTAHWRTETEPIAAFSLVTQESAPDSRWHTIVCGPGGSPHNVLAPNPTFGQDSIIMAFAELFRIYGPNILADFNGWGYDHPFIVEKARQMRLLSHMAARMSAVQRKKYDDDGIYRFQYNDDRKVKISAEKQVIVNYLKFSGWVPIDTRVRYMKLFPKADKTSLKAFLARVGLEGKADMPYTRLWKIYEASVEARDRYCEAVLQQQYSANDTVEARAAAQAAVEKAAADGMAAAEMMRHVSHYCVVDSKRCQELLEKRNVTQNIREVTTLSFTSFPDGVFYADGHKVCNMLFAYAKDLKIAGSMIALEFELEGKYEGAFVLFPVKGLEHRRPVTGLDFSSLYPSIIMAYNLSLEKYVPDNMVEKYRALGYTVKKTNEFSFGTHMISGHFVAHNADPEQYGIMPRVLIDLKKKRKGLKKILKPLEAEIEHLETVDGAYREVIAKPETEAWRGFFEHFRRTLEQVAADAEECARLAKDADEDEVDELQFRAKTAEAQAKKMRDFLEKRAAEISSRETAAAAPGGGAIDVWFHHEVESYFEDLEFKFAAVDSKQKAVKVYMNTFYGESGNKRSPIFLLELAGAVTSYGKENLKAVWQFVLSKGYTVMYGDTDSLYLCCPFEVYREVEAAYWARLAELGITPPPNAGNGAPRPDGAVGDPAELWDMKVQQVHDEIAKREAAFAGMQKAVADASSVPVDSPAFAARHPDYAAALTQGRKLLAEKVAGLRQAEAALGPRPSETAEENMTWLRDVYATRPELREPVEEAYLALSKQKIRITMKEMAILRDGVNKFLEERVGSKFLSMAYEEALCPYVSTGKKKYFGIAHVNSPNFGITDPKKLFIRGIDVIKQGQTRLSKEIGYQCMWAATRLRPPGDRDSLMDLVVNVIRENCEELSTFRANDPPGEKWRLEDFIQSDAWKPDKQNVSVHKFMARMRVRHTIQLKQNELRVSRGLPPLELDFIPPEAGERFNYLLCKADRSYDLRGYVKGTVKKGDMMEYVHVAKKENLNIDVPYYLIHYVVGLCARFINYEDQFQAPPTVTSEKARDDKAQQNAKRFLTNLIKSFDNTDKAASAQRGRTYKKVYSSVAERACDLLRENLGGAHAELLLGTDSLLGKDSRADKEQKGVLDFELFLPPEEDEDDGPLSAHAGLVDTLMRLAARRAAALCDEVCAPGPHWGCSPNGRFRGMMEAAIEGFGVDSTPAGRKQIYRSLAVLEQPSRRALLRKGTLGRIIPPPALVFDRFLRATEQKACMVIEQWSPALTGLAGRIESTLQDLVTMGRALEAKDPQTSPEALEESIAETELALDCTVAERRAVADVHYAWHQLVAAAFQRECRRRLAARLAALRDRAA